jgi:phospholipase/lecithinase/hemolysin
MRRLISASLALLASALVAPAAMAAPAAPDSAHPYSMLYVFGDSYSDSGSGYVDANGPTAVVYLAQRLGIPFTYYGDPASTGKGLNFAVSAAITGEGAGRRLPTGPMFAFGMKNQVANFVQYSKSGSIPKIDPQNTMFYFAGGLNDGGQAEGVTRANIEAEIETLYELGARRFMVALLPVKIPAFAKSGAKGNLELSAIPEEERAKHPDIRIALSNWGPFFDEVITNPAKYGITDTTNECAKRSFTDQPAQACPDPEAHFYYHSAHPSTAAHRAVGEMLYQEALAKAP